MDENTERRRWWGYFVEPYRQIRISLVFVALNIVFALLLFGVMGYYFLDVYKSIAFAFSFTPEDSQQVIQKLKWPILAGGGILIVFAFLTFILAARYTHSLYGPLVALRRHVEALSQGVPVPPLELRQGDEFGELANGINRLTQQWGREDPSSGEGSSEALVQELEQVMSAWIEGRALPKISKSQYPGHTRLIDLVDCLIREQNHSGDAKPLTSES